MTTRPLALITGASSGIGKALSMAFAQRGYDLALVARSGDKLKAVSDAAQDTYGVACVTLPIDLAVPDAGTLVEHALNEAIPGRKVEVLINNAGFGMYGALAEQDRTRALEQVRLNVLTLTDLTMRYLPAMVSDGHGTIINIASTAAFQPIPGMAIYAATKAYVKSFTEAMWAEVRGTGVRVLAVCPGPTDTNFFNASGATVLGAGRTRSAQQVVDHTMRALQRGASSIVDGFGNAIAARVATRLAPTRLMLAVAGAVVGWTRKPQG